MSTNGLWDKRRLEIKLGSYGVAPPAALTDPSLLPRLQDYRRQTSARMVPLGKSDIQARIPTAEYHVSRKIDGEFTVLVYRRDQCCLVNSGGTVRVGLPCQAEAERWLADAGVHEALVVGELYAASQGGRRPHVHDVTKLARQPESSADLERLRLAVFDLLTLDGQPPAAAFDETWKTILRLFERGEKVHPVQAVHAKQAGDIDRLFQQWVEQEGAEGLVVRSEMGGWFKIKPHHHLDAAVIGFTEGSEERRGLLHDLLLAVMRRDETLHVLTRLGGGFTDDQRRTLLSDLKDMVVDSEYAEVNADHVAYHMVEPLWVVELRCLDLVSQTTRGGPFPRMVLRWSPADRRYEVIRRMPLVSVISPQFIRLREDKAVTPTDVRIQQIADLVDVPLVDRDASQMTFAKSEILRREVYTKQLKGETMVRKFLLWKTNKETESEDYPAYVVHYTDFSPNRQTPLVREVRVSNSREQIDAIWTELKEGNVKKGWEPAPGSGPVAEQAPAGPETAAEPGTRKTARKTGRKKAAPADGQSIPAATGSPAEPAAAVSQAKKHSAAPAKGKSRSAVGKTKSAKKTAAEKKGPARKTKKKSE